MTIVNIPPVLNGAGDVVPGVADVRLIRVNGSPVIAFLATDLATEYQAIEIPADGLALELAPKSQLALPDAAATWYRIMIRTAHRQESWTVQVPVSIAPVDLRDLVAAVPISPMDITAELVQRVIDSAAAVAADRIQTGADRVQTGLDAEATTAAAQIAAVVATAARAAAALTIAMGWR